MKKSKVQGLFSVVRDWQSYRNIFYLLFLFPVGTATFTIAITVVSVAVSLLFAPLWMWTSDPWTWGSWTFDPFPYSFLFTLIGIPLLLISLHLMNRTAALSHWLVQKMPGKI